MTMSTIDPRLVVTTATIPGEEIEASLGIARGSSVRSRHVGSDIVAALRNLVGGEVKEYVRLMGGTREQAIDRMLEDAARLGADGVVEVRLTTSMIMQGSAEVLAYGTAVRLRRHG